MVMKFIKTKFHEIYVKVTASVNYSWLVRRFGSVHYQVEVVNVNINEPRHVISNNVVF